MKDKVYFVLDFFDGPVTGVANYIGKIYYFEIFELKDDNSEIYKLTELDNQTFKLQNENWDYWLNWLNKSPMPHPVEYAKLREGNSFESLINPADMEKWILAENYFQNQININKYLINTPYILLKGTMLRGENRNDWSVIWEKLN